MSNARSIAEEASQDRFILPPAFSMSLHNAAGCAGSPSLAESGDPRVSNPPPSAPSWQQAVRDQFRDPGVQLREIQLDPKGACATARPGTPLVTWSETSGWLALLDGNERGGRVCQPVASSSWMPMEALEADLGSAKRTWIAIESGLSAASRTGADGRGPLRRLLEIVRPQRGDVIAIVLYSAFIGLATLAIPIAVQQLVNTVAFGGLVQPVVVLALMLLIGLAIAASLSAFQSYLAELLQRRIFVRACVDLAHRLPRVTRDAFGHRPAQAYVNRFFDLVTLQKTGARLLLDGSSVLLQTTAGLLILSFYHPLMLGLSLVLVATMTAVVFSGRGATPTAIRESAAKYDLAEWMEELVRHGTTFRTSAGRAHATSRADALITAWVTARRRHYRIVFRQFLSALGLQVLVNTLVLALGGYLVVSGEITLGQLVASEIIVAAVVSAFARLSKHFESFYDLLAAVDKVGGLLDLPLESTANGGFTTPSPGPAALAAHGVSATPGGRSALRNLNLRIERGERVALVGECGSGKSALVDLFAGIREPGSGYISLNDEDLRELAPEVVRDRIAVLREPQILPASVLENLCLAHPDARPEMAREALASVGLLEEIRELPDGMRTVLRPDGAPLNRSQASRLEIARVLIARPSVLILDDALVHLDDTALKPVLDAVLDPAAPWTVLVVSRDTRILDRCDRIIRLENGELADEPARSPRLAGSPE